MDHATHLWLFFVLVAGIVLLPGLDMAFVLASALGGGRRAGLSAVAGIVSGGACHVLVAATGTAVLLQSFPATFTLLLWAGALYVGWLGLSLLRSGAGGLVPASDAGVSAASVAFRRGALTNLLNPKAYLFMLAVFPQFLRPEYGPTWLQALQLWAIIALTQAAVYGGLALAADAARRGLVQRPRVGAAVGRGLGALLLGVALLSVLST